MMYSKQSIECEESRARNLKLILKLNEIKSQVLQSGVKNKQLVNEIDNLKKNPNNVSGKFI